MKLDHDLATVRLCTLRRPAFLAMRAVEEADASDRHRDLRGDFRSTDAARMLLEGAARLGQLRGKYRRVRPQPALAAEAFNIGELDHHAAAVRRRVLALRKIAGLVGDHNVIIAVVLLLEEGKEAADRVLLLLGRHPTAGTEWA